MNCYCRVHRIAVTCYSCPNKLEDFLQKKFCLMPLKLTIFCRVFSKQDTSYRARVVEMFVLFSLISVSAVLLLKNFCFTDKFFQTISVCEHRVQTCFRKHCRESLIAKKFLLLTKKQIFNFLLVRK